MYNLASIMSEAVSRDVSSIAKREAKRRRDIHAKRLKRAQDRAERDHAARLEAMEREAEGRIAARLKAKEEALTLTFEGGRKVRPIR